MGDTLSEHDLQVKEGKEESGPGLDYSTPSGLAANHQHCTQFYLCCGTRNQWGITERFNKTLKEQIINGRIYRNIYELRVAVAAFVELYNQHWLVEKLGFKSPKQARDDFKSRLFKAAA